MEVAVASAGVFLGAVVQGSIGFGLSLVAVPVLILVEPRLVPGPILCVAIVLTLLLSHRERDSIDFFGVGWALAGRLPGTAVGAVALLVMPRDRLSLLFGILVLLAVLMSSFRLRLQPTAWSLSAAGLLSGFMGTTAAIGGPPIALLLQRLPGDRLRGTLSGFFLVGASVSLLALTVIGRFGGEELRLAVLLLPGILLGFWVSAHTARFLDRGYTRAAVLAAATAAGLIAVLKHVW
ncbi:MAG: sulfite exporter TauE/SafE family protein [Gemmatimonadota bacterium]|nr:MAG: sulfite exporter TauE/SafE family protein [Gemmatimonadota bacterium]